MKTYSSDNSTAMANAEDAIYPNIGHLIEQQVFNVANACINGYAGGTWQFKSDGQIGYWVYPDQTKYSVSVGTNGYGNDHMDADSLGLAITIIAVNRLMWHFHSTGGYQDAQRVLHERYHALRDLAFNDDSPFDAGAIYGFID